MASRQPDEVRDTLGYVHPASVAEVVAIVRAAREAGTAVRVRGAGHSVPAAVVTDGWLRGDHHDGVDLVLDRLRHVVVDASARTVTAGAGVRFGPDPLDPVRDEGLLAALDRQGLALPNLGGIVHQTIVGFLLTGSAGGSVRHDLHACVRRFTLVDGTGAVRTIARGDPTFHAVGVSLGLLGVVVELELDVVPRFDLVGTETIVARTEAPFDCFADGAGGLGAWLAAQDYARVLWWPQRGVDRLVLWEAQRVAGEVPRAPYAPFPRVLGSTLPMQAAAAAALAGVAHWRGLVGPRLAGPLGRRVVPRIKAPVYRAFVPAEPNRPQRFSGSWHEVLPMDDGMDERLLPTTFTEVWVPLSRAGEALRRLHEAFEAGGDGVAGRFAVELYASGASPFWLSPAHDGPCLRINVFWLEHDPGDPRDRFFPGYWAALEPLGPRLHWGKLLPRDLGALGRSLAARTSRWSDFLAARAAADPDGVFLNAAWRAVFDLPGAVAEPPSPLPRRRQLARRRGASVRLPLLFSCAPSDASLLDTADLIFDVQGDLPVSPELAVAMVSDERSVAYTPLLRRWEWLGKAGAGLGARFEETFVHMTLRMHTVDWAPTRAVMSVERCTWPLGRRMCMVMEAAPKGEGSTLRIRVAVELLPGMKPLVPVLAPPFRLFFQSIVDGLRTYVERTATRP